MQSESPAHPETSASALSGTVLREETSLLILYPLIITACVLTFAGSGSAWQEPPEPPPAATQATASLPDVILPTIDAALQGVTTPDFPALSKALHIAEGAEDSATGAATNTLWPVGDLDGDGVPEMLLKWAIPDVVSGSDVTPVSGSRPLWAIYVLSWTGDRWKASRLLTGVENFKPVPINLGTPVGRGLAIVSLQGDAAVPFPSIFRVRDHAAMLLWDAQDDDSRYQPLLQGHVSFLEHAGAPAEMIVTGRADPGFLQVKREGRRGFQARAVYHWSGTAFIPQKTEYSPSEDYTVYRFIAALHLHDYNSAYSLVVPAAFVKANLLTLDVFRHFIQENWPEFLENEVFEAPEDLPARPTSTRLYYQSPASVPFITRFFLAMVNSCSPACPARRKC